MSTKRQMIEKYEKTELGFWLYLMTDIILFCSLFATYMILRGNTAGGESAAELLDPRYALLLTVILLSSSFTCGIATLGFRFKRPRLGFLMLGLTLVAGAAFLTLELAEFTALVAEGNSWQASAFLSAFFVLVGTHGLHIAVGLLWCLVMIFHVRKVGVTGNSVRRLTLFALFWHFLDLIWIFLFAIVYLGAAL